MFIFKTIHSIHSNQIYFNLKFTRNQLVHVYFFRYHLGQNYKCCTAFKNCFILHLNENVNI